MEMFLEQPLFPWQVEGESKEMSKREQGKRHEASAHLVRKQWWREGFQEKGL